MLRNQLFFNPSLDSWNPQIQQPVILPTIFVPQQQQVVVDNSDCTQVLDFSTTTSHEVDRFLFDFAENDPSSPPSDSVSEENYSSPITLPPPVADSLISLPVSAVSQPIVVVENNKLSPRSHRRVNDSFWSKLQKPMKVDTSDCAPSSPSSLRMPGSPDSKQGQMESFPFEQIVDFKHLIYNLLVENFNDAKKCTFCQPVTVIENGVARDGFRFNESENPDKKLPELYAQHIRKADLQRENQSSVFIQDLYKFYLRACVELLSKYFEKKDKYTYLYDDIQLFIVGGSLSEAESRMSKMGTRQRKVSKRKSPMDIDEEKPKRRSRK